MKRTRLVLIVMLVMLAAATALVACNGKTSDAHSHEFGEWTVLRQATCSELGLRSHRCKICGADFAEQIPRTEHSLVTVSGNAATCTASGSTDSVVCTRCGEVIEKSEQIPALGHHWVAVSDDSANGHHHICDRAGCDAAPDYTNTQLELTTVDATCESDGYTEHSCKVCNFAYRESIPAIGHDWGEYTQKKVNGKYVHVQVCSHDQTHVLQSDCTIEEILHTASCEEAGYTEYRCSVCMLSSIEDEVEAPGHDFGDDGGWHTVVESTCEAQGMEQRECQRTLADGSKCSHVETKPLPLAEHQYDEWSVTIPSTCTDAGVESRTCSVCNDVETRSAALKPHDYGDWDMYEESTCSVAGTDRRVCNDCEAYEERARELLAHTPQDVAAKDATCLEAGNKEGHDCSVCGAVIDGCEVIPAMGHKWGDWSHIADTEEHERSCERGDCTEKQREFCAYNITVVEPRCEAAGYTEYACIDCRNSINKDEVPALGHEYGEWIADNADEKDGEHVHTHHHVCRRCADTRTEICELEFDRKVEPTCTVAGYSVYSCPSCHSEHEQDIVDASGHNFTYTPIGVIINGKYRHNVRCSNEGCKYFMTDVCNIEYHTVEATCESDGYTYGSCELCNYELPKTSIVKRYEHNWTTYEHDEELSADGHHTHSRHCTRCFMTQTDNCALVDHTLAPTCQSTGKNGKTCSVCSVFIGDGDEIEALGHKWGAWQYDEGTDEHYHICENDSTHRESFPHSVTTTHTIATCTEAGQIITTCQECSYRKVEDDPEQPALGHNYKVISSDKDGHHVVCQNDPAHTDDGSHDWSESNLCAKCAYDGLTYTKSGAHYIVSGSENVRGAREIVIPAYHKGEDDASEFPVRMVASKAFMKYTSLERAVIPYTVESIGSEAFSGCTALAEVVFEKNEEDDSTSLKSITFYAFFQCSSLTSIELPDSLVTLQFGAFMDCTRLKNITAGDDLTDIGGKCFAGTAFLNDSEDWDSGMLYLGRHLIRVSDLAGEHVTLRQDTLSISSEAFSDCKKIKKLTVYGGLKMSDSNAFANCTSIEEVIFEGSIEQWLAITFVNDYSSPLHYAARLSITGAQGAIVIPESVTAIPAGTFRGTGITSVDLGSGLKSIGEDAFRDCESLTVITGGENVTYIGADAFTGSAYYEDRAANWSEGALYIGSCLVAVDNTTVGGEFHIRAGVKAIAPFAFKDNMLVTSIVIPEGVEFIGEGFISGVGAQLTGITFENPNYSYLARNGMGISRIVGGGRDFSTPETTLAQFRSYTFEWKLYSRETIWNG